MTVETKSPAHSFVVDRAAVRRFLTDFQGVSAGAVRPSALESDRVLSTIRRLECVQIDPVALVARNQHLVLSARMPDYEPGSLDDLLDGRRVFEYWAHAACVIPIEDFYLFEPTRRRFSRELAPRLHLLGSVVDRVISQLEASGPIAARAFESSERVHGYWDNQAAKTKATSHALNLLLDAGRVMVVHRDGAERFFDLTEHAVPADVLEKAKTIDLAEAEDGRLEKYLRAFRVFDWGDPRFGWAQMPAAERREAILRRVAAGTVVPLSIDGARRQYFVLAQDLDALRGLARDFKQGAFERKGPIRFLPPLDNLLWRRQRVAELFEFTYTWEIYLPRAKRRYGSYAMPILDGDCLVGRMDPQLDRANDQMIVHLLHMEPGVRPARTMQERLAEALHSFARFHGVSKVKVEKTDWQGKENVNA